jgi:hypothetical protein
MLGFRLLVCALGLLTILQAHAAGPIIKIDKVERTIDAIVISGSADVVPPGTKFTAKVLSINGKALSDPTRMIIAATDKVEVRDDRRFEVRLQRWGSLQAFDFPTGKYDVEFTAYFNVSWQTPAVLKAAGVPLDDQGRGSLDSEPKLIPPSPDLRRERMMGGAMARVLHTTRTVTVSAMASPLAAGFGRTRSIRLEIHDTSPAAKTNPVRSIRADNILQRDVPEKVGRVTATQAIALVCVGPFPMGYIANDLFFPGGRPNRELTGEWATTLKETCFKMEQNCRACK